MSHQEEMRKAFIADIAANPEDMTPRLIFADWLQDNGEPGWAKFIQGQIEFANDEIRSQALLTPYMFDKLTPSVGGGATGYTIRRGFVEGISAPLSVLKEHLPVLVQEHPILSVRATDREPQEDRGAFCWYREGSYVARETAMIPEEVWLRLENDDDNDIPSRCRFCAYRTAEHAHAALSKALLKLARDKVVSPAAPA